MALIDCPHCGETVFTVNGWADLDRCPECGKPLARARRFDRGDDPGGALARAKDVLRKTRSDARTERGLLNSLRR